MHACIAKQLKQPASLSRVTLKPGLFPWLGRRMGLTGWTPYPCSSARADAPCGPFAALGQTPSTCAFSAPQTRSASGLILLSERVCPTAVGAGAVRPRTAVPALGGLSAQGLTPCRLPLHALPGLWDLAVAPAERPARPFGCLRAGALRSRSPAHASSTDLAGSARWPGGQLQIKPREQLPRLLPANTQAGCTPLTACLGADPCAERTCV